MTLELIGFDGPPFVSLPPNLAGYGLLGLYGLLALVSLAFTARDFARLSGGKWLVFLALTLAGAALAQIVVVHLPANILPPPGVPTESRAPGLALFALVPAFLAGGWLGVGPALFVGAVTGAARSAWDTYSLITPFEYALVGGVVAACVQQDYRGLPAALLRHPAIAGALAGLMFWPLLYLSYFAYSGTTDLSGWDYVNSLVQATAPAFIGQALIAGVAAELTALGLPGWWPQRPGARPAPYVSSLTRKLLFGLIPLFLLGIALLFWADVTIATRVSTSLVLDEMQTAAVNAGQGIPFFVQTGRSLIRDIAGRENWAAADSLERAARLSDSLRAVPFFRQLTLYDANAKPLAAYPGPLPAAGAANGVEDQLVRLAVQGVPQDVTAYPQNPAEPVEVVFVSPVLDPATKQPLGALAGRADLISNPFMQSVTQNLQGLAGGAGQGFIVDDRGFIIYHPDPGQMLLPFAVEQSAPVLRRGSEGELAYQDRAPDGTRRLVYYYPVPGHPWTVVVMVPNAWVLKLATNIAAPIIIILLLIGLMGLIFVSLIAGRVTRPAVALAEAAQRIAEGQLDRPVAVAGDDEVGRAGLAFERMREKLRARLDELGMLLRVSQGVASSLNLNEVLQPILQGALSVSGAAGIRVVLVPNGDAQLTSLGAPAAHQAFALGPAATLMAPLDRSVVTLVRDEGRAVIENLARARAVLDVTPVAGKLLALLALPLRQENIFHGTLWLSYDQPHTFSETEVNFLTTLAGQAAVAVANARLYQAADQGRQRLSAILASTPDAIIVTDPNEHILLLNPAAEQALELIGQRVIGKPVAEAVKQAELLRVLTDRRPGGATGEFEIAAGRTLYASASTIIAADGSTLGRVCVLRDVTHFKELDLMKSEFVATVSHDLRAPLTFMRGYATMLPMVGTLNDKQKEFADKITLGIEQMTELIDALLDLGRIEAGVGLAREPVRLDEIVNGVVETNREPAVNKGLKLSVDFPASLPALSGDRTLLRQAVSNLVDNAIKYTPTGGTVQLRVAYGDSKFLLAVADSGLGIAPADQAHLFEKFFRVKQRGSTQVKGSGLGLAIVKSITERHGGRVWVESRLGKGSTFYMEVPQNGAG